MTDFFSIYKTIGSRRGAGLVEANFSVDSNRDVSARGNTHLDRTMSADTREKVLTARLQEIEAFARDRGLDPLTVIGVSEYALRTGRVPNLAMYGLGGDDMVAVKHFVAGNVLNVAGMEALDWDGTPIEEYGIPTGDRPAGYTGHVAAGTPQGMNTDEVKPQIPGPFAKKTYDTFKAKAKDIDCHGVPEAALRSDLRANGYLGTESQEVDPQHDNWPKLSPDLQRLIGVNAKGLYMQTETRHGGTPMAGSMANPEGVGAQPALTPPATKKEQQSKGKLKEALAAFQSISESLRRGGGQRSGIPSTEHGTFTQARLDRPRSAVEPQGGTAVAEAPPSAQHRWVSGVMGHAKRRIPEKHHGAVEELLHTFVRFPNKGREGLAALVQRSFRGERGDIVRGITRNVIDSINDHYKSAQPQERAEQEWVAALLSESTLSPSMGAVIGMGNALFGRPASIASFNDSVDLTGDEPQRMQQAVGLLRKHAPIEFKEAIHYTGKDAMERARSSAAAHSRLGAQVTVYKDPSKEDFAVRVHGAKGKAGEHPGEDFVTHTKVMPSGYERGGAKVAMITSGKPELAIKGMVKGIPLLQRAKQLLWRAKQNKA